MSYSIDGQMLRQMLLCGTARLASLQKEIDKLNVFPVPDGDTGSNMTKTLEGGAAALERISSDNVSEVMSAFATGALFGARGNSGVILSQILKGVEKGLKDKQTATANDLGDAFLQGVKQSYAAVARPVEGTILTVFREAADAFVACAKKEGSVEEALLAHLEQAKISLENTKELLPVLKEANVIDSGAAGYLSFAEGAYQALTGEEIAVASVAMEEKTQAKADFSLFTRDSVLEFGYCTEFFLRLQSSKVEVETFATEALKAFLESIGDSVVFVVDGDLIKVHVHTMTPGVVLNEFQKYGEFLSLKIENMTLQHEEKEAPTVQAKKYCAVVSVASGEGMKELFLQSGADVIVDGGQTQNPSSGDFIQAFEKANAENIIVLPNNSNILLAAKQAAELYAGAKVFVLETKTLQEGYGALMVVTDCVDDVEALCADMQEAARGVSACSVTYAVRDASVSGHEIKAGEYLGFCGKELLANVEGKLACLKAVLSAMDGVDEKEIVTIFYGADVTDEEREAVADLIEEICPDAELVEYDGGQEVYSFLVALE